MTAAIRPASPSAAASQSNFAATMARSSVVPSAAGDPAPVARAVATLRCACLSIHRPLDDAEADAMATIYVRYRDMMLATARRVLGTRADAEDAVHDVFTRLPGLIAQYHGHGLGGWLRRVVRNEALMLSRRTGARGEVEVLDTDLPAGEPGRPTHDEDISHAVAQLPLPLREVVVLRHFVGCTHREIAGLLEISAGASEIRLCRATKRLRLMLCASARSTPVTERLHESSAGRGASSC